MTQNCCYIEKTQYIQQLYFAIILCFLSWNLKANHLKKLYFWWMNLAWRDANSSWVKCGWSDSLSSFPLSSVPSLDLLPGGNVQEKFLNFQRWHFGMFLLLLLHKELYINVVKKHFFDIVNFAVAKDFLEVIS